MTRLQDETARARDAVGRARHELGTPALILDVDVARANIARMAERVRELPVELRPHIKVHKSPELARLQVEAGAIGLTTATAWEAIAMVEAGLDDVLVANEVVGDAKLAALADAAGRARVALAVDDPGNLADVAAAARARGTELGVLVEVDVGMGRCGTRDAEQTRALAERAGELDGVRWEGVMGYEGHCMLEPDRQERVRKARLANAELLEHVDALAGAGLHAGVVSAGGTGTYDITGANPRVTEIQAGSYVVMDAFHASLIPGFGVALTVLGSVLSRHGAEVVLDCGRKAIGTDLRMPRLRGTDAEPLFVHEEHSGFAVPEGQDLVVGDRVELESGYGPTTANLYDVYHVVEGGVVVDLWPVQARYGSATAA